MGTVLVKYKAILFDLDDTLLDSISARVKTLERVFASVDITHLEAERFLRDLQGTPLETALIKLAADLNINTDLFEEYRRIYWSKEKGLLRLYPGVAEVLENLRRLEFKLGIVTTKTMNFEFGGNIVGGAAGELEEVGVADLFSVLVGFEHVALRKPHPEGINLALNRLEIAPPEALMVGDSASDIKAAQAAGCPGCYATWGLPSGERNNLLTIVSPDFIIDSPHDLLKVLDARG